MSTPFIARLRATTPTPNIPTASMRRTVSTRKQKSSVENSEEDVGSYLTGANKFPGKGGRLGAGDAIFLAVGIAVVGYVGWLAKDEVKEVTWPEIKQKGKEVKEAVRDIGGK